MRERGSGSVVGRDAAAMGKAVAIALPLAFQRLGDLEGELDRLARVEARVAMREVVGGQPLLADLLSTPDAFGDLLPGQLEMHAARIAALGEMDREGAM